MEHYAAMGGRVRLRALGVPLVAAALGLSMAACDSGGTNDGGPATDTAPSGLSVSIRGRGGYYVGDDPYAIGNINIKNPSTTPGECISDDFNGQMTVTDGSGKVIGLVEFVQPGSWEGSDCIYETTVDLPRTDFYIFTMDGSEGELKLAEADLAPGPVTFETYNGQLREAAF